jgi:hypothetical protein
MGTCMYKGWFETTKIGDACKNLICWNTLWPLFLLQLTKFLVIGLNTIKIYEDNCHNPTLRECEDETHTPEMGTWESSGTPESSEFDCKGQNTSHWGVLYIIKKLLKCECPKWARMTHLEICNTSYGQKNG